MEVKPTRQLSEATVSEFAPVVVSLPREDALSDGNPHRLSWELRASRASLIETARQVTEQAADFPDWLLAPSVSRALAFALTVELLAVSSVMVVTVPLCYLLLPSLFELLALLVARVAVGWVSLLVTTAGMALLMVALHVLWAVVLEWGIGIAGGKRRWRKGIALACYACGWDLVTSPLGLVVVPNAADLVTRAVRAPRVATQRYLNCLSKPQRRRALAIAGAWTLAVVIVAAVGGVVGLTWLALRS